jgi:hypothetical protein
MTIEQKCGRRCGVKRHADMNSSGYLTTGWSMDYREAKNYLMVDENGRSLGRIDAEARARLRIQQWADVPTFAAEDD